MTDNNENEDVSLNDIFDFNDNLMDDDNEIINDNVVRKKFNLGERAVNTNNKTHQQITNNNSVKETALEEIIYISDDSSFSIKNDQGDKKKTEHETSLVQSLFKLPHDKKDQLTNTKMKEKASLSNKEKEKKNKTNKAKDIHDTIQKELTDMSFPCNDVTINKIQKQKKTKSEKVNSSFKEKEAKTHIRPIQHQHQQQMDIEPHVNVNLNVNSQETSIETVDLFKITKKIKDHYSQSKKNSKKLDKILEVSKLFDPTKDLLTNYEKIFHKDNNLTIQLFQFGYEYYASLYFQLTARLKNSQNKIIEINIKKDYNQLNPPLTDNDPSKKKMSSKKQIHETQSQLNTKTSQISQKDQKANETNTLTNSKQTKGKLKNEEKPTENQTKEKIKQPNRKESDNDLMDIDEEFTTNTNTHTNCNSILNKLQEKKKSKKQESVLNDKLTTETIPYHSFSETTNNNNDKGREEIKLQTSSTHLKTKQEIDEYMDQDPIYSIIKEKINELNSDKNAMEYLCLALPNDIVEFIHKIINGQMEKSTNQLLLIELYRHDYFISKLIYNNCVFSIQEEYINLK